METAKVGIREFRSGLADFIASGTPVAITRHGNTVGFFIPAQSASQTELVALRKASETLDALLAAHAVDPDELVADFKSARQRHAKSLKNDKERSE